MGDVEKGDAGVLQRAYPVKKTGDLFSLELGRRLVQNDEPAALQKRTRDLDDLPLLDSEPPSFQIGRDPQVPFAEGGDRRILEAAANPRAPNCSAADC